MAITMGEFNDDMPPQYITTNPPSYYEERDCEMPCETPKQLRKPCETPKQLRKRAKRLERDILRQKKAQKKYRRELKRRQADREAVRKGLLLVMKTDKGYGKAEVARALSELGMI